MGVAIASLLCLVIVIPYKDPENKNIPKAKHPSLSKK